MNGEIHGLAAHVRSLALDAPGSVETFSRRLARENRWSPSFTARVI